MKLKLLFLSPARYPTEKAYGVTTGNTVRQLARMGINVEIWNPDVSGVDEYGNTLLKPGKKVRSKQRRFYQIGFLGISRWAYFFDQLKFSVDCLLAINEQKRNAVAWTRFPLVGFVTSFSPKIKLVIIELHHQPNFFSRLFIGKIKKSKPLKVAVITQRLKSQFDSLQLGIPSFTLEMSVPEEFIQDIHYPLVLPASVCYLGKSKSSGNDNNLEFILTAFSKMSINSEIQLELTGIESTETNALTEKADELRIPTDNIKFIQHIPHKGVGAYLDGVSVGLVPYELNKYNSSRFPIKILEYASKGIWILAAQSFAENLQLPPNVIFTYRDHDSTDLANILESLLADLRANPRRNAVALEFAKCHTYTVRAEKFLFELESFNLA